MASPRYKKPSPRLRHLENHHSRRQHLHRQNLMDLVVGERKDQHMIDTTWTDDNGAKSLLSQRKAATTMGAVNLADLLDRFTL